jgi:DNA-binding transcriptional regulator YiaG
MQKVSIASISMDKLMNQDEVAEYLGVSVKTLEAWRCRKKGPSFIKLGRLARYRMLDILAYIQGLIDKEVR